MSSRQLGGALLDDPNNGCEGDYIHPSIFDRRALWADRVSPQMNTIASHDHFKPITIVENLVVNYN